MAQMNRRQIYQWLLTGSIVMLVSLCGRATTAQPPRRHDLLFDTLPGSWDEAVPLGNGLTGALVWQKDGHLRFSLDRSDIWDQRPMKGLHRKEFSYRWVYEQVKQNNYAQVQQYFDAPYDREAAPSKIPCGALEFDSRRWGRVQAVHLSLQQAVCTVQWNSGVVLRTFVHARQPMGWFRLEHVPAGSTPLLVAPAYEKKDTGKIRSNDISRLGYEQGRIVQRGHTLHYRQEGWDGFAYEIGVAWKWVDATTMEGVWHIAVQQPGTTAATGAAAAAAKALQQSFAKALATHESWWRQFWQQSALQLPDTLLEKQWYRSTYLFGAAVRKGAPPVSLQGVWTADNGRLPPWKGDYHHDLNTELSYWPAYSGNHLEEAMSFLDHLDHNKANYKRYTKLYFGTNGLAVPGVTTLDGTEMGGWIPYALSPTIAAWLSQHYYWQWQYGRDKRFLQQRAYPWLKETAAQLEQLTYLDAQGHRQLPLSSSPEINNNSRDAWFLQNTNYDLALMKFVFGTAAVLADTLGLTGEAVHWRTIQKQLGDYALSENGELLYAPGMPYRESHRHFSHAMAIYPLGLIRWEDGPQSQRIIRHTLAQLDAAGPDNWNGYSYAWLGSLKARAKDGAGAAQALTVFAKAFCSVNGFHVNGDQTHSGYSKRTYRPFTLEGNFAFASGVQEMLLQSYAGVIEIMPAVPPGWSNVSFTRLRAEGAFLVSAQQEQGSIKTVRIYAEQGGLLRLQLPFAHWRLLAGKQVPFKGVKENIATWQCRPGDTIVLAAE
jgi:hypothetical protein